MEKTPDDPEAAAKKARSKAAHRYSMLGTGWWMIACGLAAAYLAVSRGDLPPIMYGHLSRPAPAPLPAQRKPAPPMLVKWRDWDSDALRAAKEENKVILLELSYVWSRAAHVRDEEIYSSPEVAALLAQDFVAIRADAEARPDLAARYGEGEAVALLLPTGELMQAGLVRTAKQFLDWAGQVSRTYRKDPARVADAYRGAAAQPPRPSAASRQDAVWGGVHHGAPPEYGKRLAEQPASALGYVQASFWDPAGGYYAAQSGELRRPDGSTMEGEHFFSLNDAGRRAAGSPETDRRLPAGPNGRAAAAALDAGDAGREARDHALKTLERWWKRGVFEGEARRFMTSGVQCLLDDQLGLAEGYAAAYEATSDARQRDRAAALVRAVETRLMDEKSGALVDRPPWGELPAGLDQLSDPAQNFEALLLYRRLVGDLPVGDPFRERLKERASSIASWLRRRRDHLSPFQLAAMDSDDYNEKALSERSESLTRGGRR